MAGRAESAIYTADIYIGHALAEAPLIKEHLIHLGMMQSCRSAGVAPHVALPASRTPSDYGRPADGSKSHRPQVTSNPLFAALPRGYV